MYKLMNTSSNKEFEVNRLLADIAARYIALYEVYGDEKICRDFLDQTLNSRAINLLQLGGFLQMYPSMHNWLFTNSFSHEGAKHLFQDNDPSAESNKLLLQKCNFIYKNHPAPKSNRFKLLKNCLAAIYTCCHMQDYPKALGINYSQSDLQILIDLVSALIPNIIKEYQYQKDYNDRIKSFGQCLNAIKNNTSDSKSDHIVLIAIVGEFKKHDFDLDDRFKAAVADNRGCFTGVNRFLSQKRVLATLFAINMEVVGMDSGYRVVYESLNIIGAINNKPKSVLNKSDITSDISKQAHLFIKSFHKPSHKSSREVIKYTVISGLRSARILAQKALSVCKYLVAGADVSLISLSLVAGPSVLIANGLLILSISVVAMFAFIADAGCFNLDKISAKFYDSSINLYNKILGNDNKDQELVIRSDYTGFKLDVKNSGNIILDNQQRRINLDQFQCSGVSIKRG